MKNDRGIISYFAIMLAIAGMLVGGYFAVSPNVALANNGGGFEVPACAFTSMAGRTIVAFPKSKLKSDNLALDPVWVPIPAGRYKVSLMSWDGYENRKTHTDQKDEQFYVTLRDVNGHDIVSSSVSDDLADGTDRAVFVGVVNTSLDISRDAAKVIAKHAKLYGAYEADSLYAVCAAFDYISSSSTPPPSGGSTTACNDAVDNDGDGRKDSADAACHSDGNPNNSNSYTPSGNSENSKPVITVLGANPFGIQKGMSFTDPGVTAMDEEDGVITSSIVKTGDAVNSNTVGLYTIRYNVVDSAGVRADEKTRVVNVVSTTITETTATTAQCGDSVDNDSDGKIDTFDAACHTDRNASTTASYDPNINDENSKPVITRLGDNPVTLFEGDSYTDAGATAHDAEDGTITSRIVRGGPTVTSSTTKGNYTITYNVSDLRNLAASEVTRLVIVQEKLGPSCPQCGGGGSPGPDPLYITNEKVQVFSSGTAAAITWDTNISATSRVAFGTTSIKTLTLDDAFGYGTTTSLFASTTKTHTVTVENLIPGSTYYFRPSSKRDAETIERTLGIELSTIPAVTTPTTPIAPGTPPSAGTTGVTPVVSGTGECFEYLRAFIRFGANNDRVEVLKLQSFLRTFEGAKTVPLSGIYDAATRDAVNAFQEKYRDDVLTPWGLKGPTGYVYITTKRHINKVYCSYKLDFALTPAQKAEIAAYRAEIERMRAAGIDVSASASDTAPMTATPAPQKSAWDVEGQTVKDKKATSSKDTTTAVIEAFGKVMDAGKKIAGSGEASNTEGRLGKIAAAISARFHPSKWIQLLLIIVLFIVGFLLYRSGSRQDDIEDDDNDMPTFGKPTALSPQKERQAGMDNDFSKKGNRSGPQVSQVTNEIPKEKAESSIPHLRPEAVPQSRITLEQLKDNLVLKREEGSDKKPVAEENVIRL